MTKQTQNKKFKRLLELKNLTRDLFSEQDKLINELAAAGIHAYQSGNMSAIIVDNFTGETIVFKTTAVKRYDVKFNKKKGA